MNERIKELANQAENYAHEQNEKFGLNYIREYEKKFAELIVEEMYDFIMEESANDSGIPDLSKVKQHFGVEE